VSLGALNLETRSRLTKRRKVQIFWGGIPANQETFLRKQEKVRFQRKLAPKSKKIELNSTNSKLNCKKSCLDSTKKPDPSVSYEPKVKNKTISVLLDFGSSGDLLFVQKGSINHISIAKWAVP
jgi:hypothetical protein